MTPNVVVIEDTGGLGPIEMDVSSGRQVITPASRVAVATIGANAGLLAGKGLDWGSGHGLLAIAAAKVPAVTHVIGLELSAADVPAAQENAARNGVADRTSFIHADSYRTVDPNQQTELDGLLGAAGFLIANPPASRTGDGLDWRREALQGGLDYLVPGAPVLLQISYQYATARIEGLVDDVPGYTYQGLAGTSDWAPFDQTRADLSTQLIEYAQVETEGGIPYTFFDEEDGHITATQALDRYRATGVSPLSKWQMHRYRRA